MSSQVLTSQTSVSVFSRLLRAHSSLSRELSARLVTEHGLTINDYEALLHLSHAEEGSLRRVDLAERLMLTPSGVTRLLDGLEALGFVENATCARDARVTYAVLTDAGRRRLEEAASSHVAAIREVFEDRYTEAELATLAELLGRLPRADVVEECTP